MSKKIGVNKVKNCCKKGNIEQKKEQWKIEISKIEIIDQQLKFLAILKFRKKDGKTIRIYF